MKMDFCASAVLKLFVVLLLCGKLSAQVYNLSLSVEEGLPARTVVGDIKAVLPSSTQSSGFFISESRDSDVFRDLEIDGDSGVITTTAVLDRESRDKYEFSAATLAGEVIKIKIVVTDVNDNSPAFPARTVELNVSELCPPGTRFELVGARDLDEGQYGTQGYRITKDMEMFKVEASREQDKLLNVSLILLEKLDREIRDFYSLTIEAFDGGVPPKTGQLQVHMNILDENDNQPVFNQSEYKAVLLENESLLTPVCQVHAVDPDLGLNGLVTYEINRQQGDPNEFFIIDGNTGVIHVNKPLDYESRPFFELLVTARDHGAQPKSSSTIVGIRVLDVNDNSPHINILFLSETGDAEVSEGAGYGEHVARISVSDPDLGEIGKARVFLEGGEGKFALKHTGELLFALCVDGPLDREQKDLYELTVSASDSGYPPLKSDRTFLLRVTDVNDNSPVFERNAYEVSVPEDVPEGSSVLQLRAHDDDEDSGIFYSILQSEQELPVNIDLHAGLITTAAGLDREKEPHLAFLVVAVDGGFPPLTSTATVNIRVEDVNDNKPVFKQQLYSVTIQEHLTIGTCFLQVSAEDGDGGLFGTVRYSFSHGLGDKDTRPLFHIDPVTGDVCISQDIDRDAGLASLDLLVKAEDNGGLMSEAYLHIDVEDVNDNAPVFHPDKYLTNISSHAQPGDQILRVVATDRDSGDYGPITYELLPGEFSSLFSVDQSTGVVSLSSPLSHLGTITLSVSAHDGEGLAAPTPADITITILHTDHAPALFQESQYSFSVPEDTPPGTSVGTVQALRSPNSVEALSYRFSSGDHQDLFSVDAQSGVISTSLSLDHESLPWVLLTVEAHMGVLPIYSRTHVNITITDTNDNPPIFQKTSDSITISHNTPPGTTVFIAHAHDQDSGPSGRIRYMLRPESHRFAIHPRLGVLTLNSEVRRDTAERYELNVVAQDEGSPSLSSSMNLLVELDDSAPAEGALAFETLLYQVEIGEGAQKDTRVIQVRAHGSSRVRGSGLASPPLVLTYSLEPLSGSSLPPFFLQPDSGWLFVAQTLDYESEPTHRFGVRATAWDGRAELTATATVVVMVQDENDNAPVFGRGRYFFSVPEGLNPRGLIGTVKARDRDSWKNGQLSYILLSDGKHFRVNSQTGELINWKALDREEQCHHTLRVMVTDHGHPRLNATTTVHILVSDINDNHPQFTNLPASNELRVQVWSGLPVGSVVTSMFAQDEDAGENGTVSFSLTSGNGRGHFEIDRHSGDIKVTAQFLQDPQTSYTLSVVATDNGPTPLQQTALIHIQVYNSPKENGHRDFPGIRLFTVKENTKLGTIIGCLRFSGGASKQSHFSVIEGNGSLHFGVDGANGDFYIAQALDYEAAQGYFLHVQTKAPTTSNATVLVAVNVEDVNDHTPWFPGDDNVVVFGVQEDAAVGTAVYVFKALDGDGTLRNSAVRYTMADDPDASTEDLPFSIDPHTGVVMTTAQLDREHTRSFAFTIIASNQPEEPDQRHASITVQAFVVDINDNSPAFVSMDTIHVAEDTEVGSLLHHLQATDEDEGPNSHVTYCLIGGNELGLFRLERTGRLYLNFSLDYESQHAFALTVQASDSGLPPLSSTCTLNVAVVDVNDESPLFEQQVYIASVMENQDAGQPVVTVSAFDLDSEENAVLSYSLLPSPGFEFFTIDSHTGLIITSTQLDRELQHSFTLRVQAEDGGTRPLSSTTTVLCTVLDDNDNPPEFSQSSIHIFIPENLPPGVIHTAHASDPDYGANGTVEYSLINADDHFSIDAVTGAISTTGVLDREECSNYTLLITASDQGPSTLTSTLLLFVSVSDENDNSPTFGSRSYRISASEGLPVGSEILWLSAQDPDEGSNGEVTFSLAEEPSGTFAVNSSTGVVRLTKALDRETRSHHVFRAVAADGCSQGPRSSVVTVTVHVDDVNDNPPTCATDLVRASVTAGNTRPGRPIATVMANDPDQGENGTIVFGLMEDDMLFQVDRSSGEVQLKNPLAEGVSGTRLVSVWVADQGTPALTSTCLLLVQLNHEEPLLKFTKELYEITIPENSKTGSWVAHVVAQDETAPGDVIKYSMYSESKSGAFRINPDTGDITVREQSLLDFELQPEVHMVVLAENGRQSAHARVRVTLQDVNDNAPGFKQSHFKTAVWEGQIHNTYVMQVLATDSDSGMNGQIDYFIVNGNHNNTFVVDSVRGILATSAVLDREVMDSYKLILEARDRGIPALTGTCTVRVQVMDVNDNSPTIPPMEPLVVTENLPAGHFISRIIASDVDLSSTITYSLSEANGSFVIDQFSGIITLTKSLDYEEQVLHTLKVAASDSVHQAEALITVQVLDVNDNTPEFSREFYQVFLPELMPADSFVMAVTATDRDSGLNGRVSYKLLSSPMSGFYINVENGSVYTNKPLRYVSGSNVIRILIEARDSGDPALFSVTSVDIQVVDSNDHAPLFQNHTYQVNIYEDAPVGSVILSLLAEDQDYSDENTHLDYVITGGNKERCFCIEVVTVPKGAQQRTVGNVVLCDVLDRETTEMYALTVTVMDRGTPALNSSTIVSLYVLDVNDHEPVFNSSEYHAHVTENSPLGILLVQVFAEDLDLGLNGTVRYDVISGNSKGLFRLNSQTGALEVNGNLDFEEVSRHTLTVRASDGGGPNNRQVSFAVVYITVLDENDNSPFFVFSTINCSVAENMPVFTPVCVVQAVDQDAGGFGLLTYSILTSCFMDYGTGNPVRNEAFAIDPLTGDIRTRQTFDYEKQSEYCFVVEARDKGDRAATVKVQIAIDGVDEFSPVFNQNLYHFVLPDNARLGQSIGHVMAMDYDGGLDGIVEYSLASSSPFFNINKTTGSIYISNPVYRKTGTILKEEVAKLMVLASSPKPDSRSAACHVVVNISTSAEALTDVAVSVQTVKLSVSLTVIFLLLISSIALALRFKTKANTPKKSAFLATVPRHGTEASVILRRDPQTSVAGTKTQDLHTRLNVKAKREISIPLRISGTSGRGSAEGETAEDQDLKMISEYQHLKQLVLPNLGARIPMEDQLSHCSAILGTGKMAVMSSVESLHNFREEGGGEGMLPQVVNMREMDEAMRGCMSLPDSLTSLISTEEQLYSTYGWNHLNWDSRFHPQPSVLSDIDALHDKGGEEPAQSEFHSLLPCKTSTQGRRPSNSKYTYSLLGRNAEQTSSAVTSGVSPSLSLLTLRTPNASPVVSETGLGSFRRITPVSADVVENAGIRA